MADPVLSRADESPLATYIAHLVRGELAYQVDADGQPVFFPRVGAPVGRRGPLRWQVSRGLGTVHATTWIAPKGETAYNVALIDMDEGFRLMSCVESVPADQVHIGMRVRVRVQTAQEGDDDPRPVFDPVDDEGVT